jgi:hypothetical protein
MPRACTSTRATEKGKSPGTLIAAALAGAWRRVPGETAISAEDLAVITPLLLGSGAGALAWWRVRDSALRASAAARELREAYRFHTLGAALHELGIKEAFRLLRAAGVAPVLVKGWAVTRLYPEKGLRPYGDIDLCVRPEEYPRAAAALDGSEARKYSVDLHEGFENLDEESVEDLYARSRLERLDDCDVRVLGPEDHLRVLCVHFLRHGAWRPLWLCDVAAAVESRPADFDWDRCLGGDRRRADWVVCTIGLAHRLLGARVEDTPVAGRASRLPGWLLPAVVAQWETPCAPDHFPPELMLTSLRHPSRVPRALRDRWPNPIEATISVKGSFNELPRLPFQLGACLSRTTRFLGRLAKA